MLLAFQAGGFFPNSWAPVAAAAAVALALRIVLAERPFAGLSRSGALVCVCLALLGAWMLASAGWSHAPGRAIVSFERLLAYGLVFATLASLPGGRRAAWTLRGVAVGIGVVCAAALLTRFAPDVWKPAVEFPDNRLAFPITYWNGLGLLAGVGVVLALHMTASAREPGPVRVLGAALLPSAACTLYLTFSRGAIAATVVGVLLYLVVGRPRAALSAAVSSVAATVIAVVSTFDAADLARSGQAATTLTAHRAGWIVLACSAGGALARAVTLWVDPRLDRARLGPRSRRAAQVVAGVAAAAAVVALVVGGAVEWTRTQAHQFLHASTPASTDLRDRLLVVSNNGRTTHWQVSLDGFDRHPWQGTGAGTFVNEWNRNRTFPGHVLNAHSLYFETLGELGAPGLALLVLALGALVVGLARRARGPDRGVAAAALAAVVTWAGHAGVDWDWQLTATTVWVFGLGAAVLATPAIRGSGGSRLPRPARIVLALAVLALAILPVRMTQSERALDRAVRTFQAGDCPAAVDASLQSLEAFATRTEPRELIAYCDVRGNLDDAAVRSIDAAVAIDPGDWELSYGRALVYAAVGRDPRPAAAEAHRLNPLDLRAQAAVKAFGSGGRRAWERRARKLPLVIE